jgi:hypothetical protein
LQIRKPAHHSEKAVPSARIRFIALFLLLLPAVSEAQTKAVVNFGRLKNLEFIDQFYNGGMGSLGTGPGPNYGLQFTANAQTIISASKGGSGNFIGNPGGLPVMDRCLVLLLGATDRKRYCLCRAQRRGDNSCQRHAASE